MCAHKQTKQVIVIRRDLKMRRGKEIAQGAHASNAFFTSRLKEIFGNGITLRSCVKLVYWFLTGRLLTPVEWLWITHSFTKICLTVKSEEELISVYEHAKLAGLEVHLITDNGATEFNGVPTKTCLAIGPGYSEEINKVTSGLTLY